MDYRLRSEFEKLKEEWSEAIVSNDAGSKITDVFTRREGRWRCVLTHLTPAVDRI